MSSGARCAHRSRVLISIQGGLAIVYCVGTLDRSVLEDLGGRVRALTREGVRGFVCSLERVSHIHFQALDSLLGLHQLSREAGGRFVLTNASPYLRQILDFGGVPGHVPMMDEKHQAIEQLHSSTSSEQDEVAAAVSVQQTFF